MDTHKSEQPTDWHPADVVSALRKSGTSLRKIALANDFSHIQGVLTRPWWVVEQLVAQSLGIAADQIWPSRYAAGVSRDHAKRLTRNRKALRNVKRSAAK